MRRHVLLAGATGAIGRPLARRLLARGHGLRALVRDPSAAADLAAEGAELRAGDVLEPASMLDAAAGCDAVIHAAVRGPDGRDEEGARLRRQGTASLLRAAERAGASVLVPSLVALYAGGGDEELDAADPVIAPGPAVDAAQEAELATFGSRARFLVLRQGVLFGPGTGSADELLGRLRSADFPVVADAPVWLPLLHPEDFAEMAVACLERDFNGVYDAVSQAVEAPRLARAAARASGAPRPQELPAAAVRERLGPDAALTWAVSRRAGPAALAELGISPRRGWERMLEEAVAEREAPR